MWFAGRQQVAIASLIFRKFRVLATFKRRLAQLLVSAIDVTVRFTGKRFYELHLDRVGQQRGLFGNIREVDTNHAKIRLLCPNRKTHWRADTFLTKEPSTLGWIDKFSEGSVMWDVGANVGLYSLYAASRNVNVLSFEPIPENYRLLCENIRLNELGNLISPFAVALTDSTGLGYLEISDFDAGSAFATFREGNLGSHGTVGKTATIMATQGFSIDDFVAVFHPPFPNHIKIDVDGIEDKVFRGAAKTFMDARLLSVTVEGDHSRPDQLMFIMETMLAAGFTLSGRFSSPLYPQTTFENLRFIRA